MKLKALYILFGLIIAAGGIAGCQERGPAEEAGQAIDEAGRDTADAFEDAGDRIEDETR